MNHEARIENLIKQREELKKLLQRIYRSNNLTETEKKIIIDGINKIRNIEIEWREQENKKETQRIIEEVKVEAPLRVGSKVRLKSDKSCLAEIVEERPFQQTKLYTILILDHKDKSVVGSRLNNMAEQYLTTIL